MADGFVPVVVPGASPAELLASLEQLDLVGSVIEGSRLGIADVAIARLVGYDDDLVVVGDTYEDSTTTDRVLAHLTSRWAEAMVGEVAAKKHELFWPVLTVHGLRTVAVTPPADLMLPTFSKGLGVQLYEARVGDRLVVGIGEPHELPPDVLVYALVNGKGRSVVLWRTDTHLGLHVMKRGKVAAAHVWEPVWTPFGHAALDDLRDPGLAGDAAAIGRLLRLSPADVVSLRAMTRLSRPDLVALADLLGLPAEVVEVLDGHVTVAGLPGGSAPEAKGVLATIVEGSEYDPAWIRWFETGARELRPWYVASSLATIVLGCVLVTVRSPATFWGVFALIITVSTALDLSVRWWLRRRRSAGT